MALLKARIERFRAFSDTGDLRLAPLSGIVGRNDTGKSGLLHGLKLFFDPPKKGGLPETDFHARSTKEPVRVELSFDPSRLRARRVKIDAKNTIDIVDDFLVDDGGNLTVRLNCTDRAIGPFEALIRDVDDPELFPLVHKNQEQLLELLKKRGLPAVVAGKETNQEKRNVLRDAALTAGSGWRCDWVDALSLEKPIRSVLPQLLFFTDQARYGIAETPVQNQFKTIVDQAVAATPDAVSIEDQIRTAIQGEFDKVFEHLNQLTDAVTGMKAEPRINWKKAVDGIDLLWSDSHGIEIPFELRGAGVRRLFMVAYFQYLATEALYEQDGPQYLFAIEEPELHLHPGAQRLLCDALVQLGEHGHQVIFTTHSPVFAALSPGDGLILVTRPGPSALSEQKPAVDLAEVARQLGVETSDRLIGKDNVVLVEGKWDVQFYEEALAALFAAGDTKLDPANVIFLQCGGVHNLHWVVTTQRMEEAGLKWAVLIDSDRAAAGGPMDAAATDLSANPPQTCSLVCVLDRTYIENYFDSAAVKAVTGVDCVIQDFGKARNLDGGIVSKGDWKKIKGEAGPIAKQMGAGTLKARSLRADGTCELVDNFEKIRAAFGL